MEDVGVLSFSGGWQSSALLWMAIRREIELPFHFAAVFADTGDERRRTYEHVPLMKAECENAGIDCLLSDGPKITDDYREETQSTRIETIPYWTKNPDGSRGQLMHCCTRHYKVRPNRRAITEWLAKRLWLHKGRAQRIPVTQWVGFAADEQDRIDKLEVQGRWRFRVPLAEMGMTKQDCVDYHRSRGLPEPIPSVCAGCFGHGLRSLKWMHDNDPDAWDRAVNRDEFIRHGLKRFGVREECYVSDTLIPLRQLAEQNFKLSTTKETVKHECASGVCFV